MSWGDVVKTNIDRNEVQSIIKKYVNKTYPDKVEKYQKDLDSKKQDAINKIANTTFIHNDLMWQDESVNKLLKLNRLELKVYCRKLYLANRKDWRVPRYDELISLVDYTKIKPANLEKIKYIDSSKYWTSSNSVLEEKKMWFVEFTDGSSGVDSDLIRYNIRCVREMSTKQGEY